MAARPLTDDEVQSEMKKMVAFIKQEAIEKAREIQVKADEEFNIEKAKLVRQETVALEAQYEKKLKQEDISRKIAHSTYLNKARLKVLEAKEEMLEKLYAEAKTRLPALSANTNGYQKLLQDLLIQCFFQLMENHVVIHCRRQDEALVSSVIAAAQSAYSAALPGHTVNAVIDKNSYLSDECAGGITVSAQEGRIKCSNTLESRLDLLFGQMLPDMRILLFGVSETRRFYN